MASIARMSTARLAEHVRAGDVPQRMVVVDVRDSDFAGGHIRGAHHIPVHELYDGLDALVSETAHKHAVVFHCMQSQMRGPSAAKMFARRVKKGEAAAPPRVYVLDGGFAAFVREFRAEPALFNDLTAGAVAW